MRKLVTALGWSVALAALAACGGEPSSKDPNVASTEERQVDERKARGLMYEGEEALKTEDFAKARDLLRQADRFADDTVRDEIRVVAERIDKAEATLLTADVVAAAKEGKCAEALDGTAELVKLPGKGATFPGFVRSLAGGANGDCLVAMVEGGGSLREVRMLAASTSAKQALGTKDLEQFEKKLAEAVGTGLMKVVGEPLEARQWPEVVAKLEERVRSGEAGPKDAKPILDQVGAGVREDVTKLLDEAMKTPAGAGAALEQVDRLLATAWSTGADGGKAADGKPRQLELPALPAELQQRRAELAFWAACSAVKCREASPTKMWIYGSPAVAPTLQPKTPGQTKLEHGSAVWQIATAAGLSLVARKDPGALEGIAARAKPAAGWVPAAALRSSDTSDWLPPRDGLVGTRVWGPLRTGSKTYEIGTVVAVEGANVKVRRMADREEVSVPLSRVQLGAVGKGLKVLAMCGGGFKLAAAVVESVKETKFEAQGDPIVKVTCLGADGQPTKEQREEQMGSIRAEPSSLPPRR